MIAGPGHLVPLVGRDSELRRLAGLARGADDGRLTCVLVDGEPGIGKTRLASEVMLARSGSTTVLRACGHPSARSVPFSVWAELVDGYFRTLSDQEVLDACAGYVDDLATVVHGAARVSGTTARRPSATRVREAFTVVVQRLAARAPVRLLLDDMHLADASSWELLGYLARNLHDSRVLVVVCARLGEVEERQVANQVLFGLEQDGTLERVELDRLSAPEVREVAERALGRSPVPHGLVSWLFHESQRHAPAGAEPSGGRCRCPRRSRLAGAADCPASLTDHIKSRLTALKFSSRAILETLAVAGRAVGEDELYLLHPATTSAGLAQLQRTRLVTVTRPGETYEVCHPLVQECVYRGLEPDRRRDLHRTVAAGLSRTGRVGEAAHHHGLSAVAGDQEAITSLVDALRDTWARTAFAEAFQVMAALVRLLPGSDPRWLDAIDAVPTTQEFMSTYNRIAFDVGSARAMSTLSARAAHSRAVVPSASAALTSAFCLIRD